MELDEDLFRALANVSDLSVGPYAPGELRSSYRVAIGRRAALSIARAGEATLRVGVMVRDLSRSGVGLMHTAGIDPGVTAVLSMSRANADSADPLSWAHVECEVMRCTRGEGRACSYTIGARFTRMVELSATAPRAVGFVPVGAERVITVADAHAAEIDRVRRAMLG